MLHLSSYRSHELTNVVWCHCDHCREVWSKLILIKQSHNAYGALSMCPRGHVGDLALHMYSIFWHEVMSPESFYKAQTNVLCFVFRKSLLLTLL